ncbi:MAG: hypothetical protein QOF05_1287 [Sphingomonadales bacterium]|jgi:hypothetical protein|nr:hypothetical protein [Sphingomonadales bacterium]
MTHSKLSTAAAAALALAAGACDWLPQRRGPSAVTVKLPPPRAAAPGFAFGGAQDAAKTALR